MKNLIKTTVFAAISVTMLLGFSGVAHAEGGIVAVDNKAADAKAADNKKADANKAADNKADNDKAEAGGGESSAGEIKKGVDSIGGQGHVKLETMIKTIVNILLFLLGSVAVVMIVIGGIKYTTSNGDPSATKSAKDTIFYSVIGLVVAILAYAIVNFIVDALVK